MASHSIIWSPMAKISYYEVLEYLDDNWKFQQLEAFIKRTEQVIGYIANNPLLYPYSRENDTHKCVVVPQISLFYRAKNSQVELLVFWDTRQNPNKTQL